MSEINEIKSAPESSAPVKSEPRKRRYKDRKDGWFLRDIDAMHVFMPYIMPNRADNEAVMNECVDLTAIIEYLNKKNADNPEFKYTFFHVICAALAKTVILRPKLNYFISGHRMYERNCISFSFVIKKKFTDDAHEALVKVKIDPEGGAPIDQLYSQIKALVYSVRREGKLDGASEKLNALKKIPRPVMRLVVGIMRILDYYGKMPESFCRDDPDYSTIFISNLGSIKMHASYHHLVNWGTNSMFCIIGEKRKQPYFADDGSYEMREALDLGLTIDERIADGVYFAKSIRILRKLLANPELLEAPASEPLDIE